ncbi:uncharacterized protein LOC120906768 isoform X1 [Anopheles arabiensis]|uniref:uncharacterized protein LOC120906768 isoform X1 n=1 Tax=Anopheles arabiensis TaxID=7173 RepID=UPI001AAD534B|nr:uncharacterized protein LOC120906768 isoform X1 [Anopheles arabiensis]XP_040174642.1 uncharacterized protein LOC120906768 isoform X1 [Anopheles arabiensis]
MAVKYDADADKEGVASGSKAPPSSPIHDDNQTDPTFQALTPMIEEQYVYYPEDVFVMIQVVRIRWLLRLIITHLVSQGTVYVPNRNVGVDVLLWHLNGNTDAEAEDEE